MNGFVPIDWPSQDQLTVSALAFGAEVLEAEARLVSAGWHDPVRLHDAACEQKLCSDDFVDGNCAAVFMTLLGCSATGTTPTETMVREVATRKGAVFDTQSVPHELERLHWMESTPEGVENYAKYVADLARRRRKAQDLIREADELLRGGLGPCQVFLRFGEALQRPLPREPDDPGPVKITVPRWWRRRSYAAV